MDINNKKIVFVCQYAAPYEGNFILSLKSLETKLQKQFQTKIVYVFPTNVYEKQWMMSFLKTHQVHFVPSEPDECVDDLLKIFEKEHPDLCHTHFDGYDVPVVKAAKMYKKRYDRNVEVIWHLHDELWYQKNLLKKWYQHYCFWRHYYFYGKGISIIAVSEGVYHFVHKYKRAFKHETILLNGIDLNRLEGLSMGRTHEPEKFTFLAYGGRNIQKRVDLLLEAGIRLDKKRLKFRIVVTKGADTDEIVSDILGVDKPDWLVLVETKENIIELFEESSCFVSTSVAETFSYAIAEASIWGLPVIQSDIEGTLWNASNPSCYLFKSLNIADLVDRMEYVMRLDKTELEKVCSITQKNNLKNYTVDSWSDKVICFYQKID